MAQITMDEETTEQYVMELCEHFHNGMIPGFAKVMDELMKYQAFDAAMVVERAILRIMDESYHYGDGVALIMEMAIRKNKEWALVGGDRNPLVGSIIQTGSMDLYECYTEEVGDLPDEWYEHLLMNLAQMNVQILASYDHILRTRDFTSGLKDENGRRSLDEDDYQTMFLATQRYNRVVGIYKLMMRLNAIVCGEKE